MSKSEKKALILENIKANALVLVQNGKVFDLTDEKLQMHQLTKLKVLL